jgi:hypothetical protein
MRAKVDEFWNVAGGFGEFITARKTAFPAVRRLEQLKDLEHPVVSRGAVFAPTGRPRGRTGRIEVLDPRDGAQYKSA